jgi:hypothetical protein
MSNQHPTIFNFVILLKASVLAVVSAFSTSPRHTSTTTYRHPLHLLFQPPRQHQQHKSTIVLEGLATSNHLFSIEKEESRWTQSVLRQPSIACDGRRSQHSRSSWSSSLLSLEASAVSTNEELLPGISAIDDANGSIASYMKDLRESPYFRLFCVDILASCEYMPQELFECYSELCEVYPVDDEMVRTLCTLLRCLDSMICIDACVCVVYCLFLSFHVSFSHRASRNALFLCLEGLRTDPKR